MLKKILMIFSCLSSSLFAHCYDFSSALVETPQSGNQFYLEPELISTTYKTSEIKQTGTLYGINGGYNLLIYNYPYMGFESHFRSGRLKNDLLKSKYQDYLFEGKIGLTMGNAGTSLFVPYGGIGYENENNDYTITPVEKIYYYYLSVGILSEFFITPQMSVGLNGKIKFPFNGDHKLKNDEFDINVAVSKKMQYQIELPIIYWISQQFNVAAVPFYEYKNYNNNSVDMDWKSKSTLSQWGIGLRGTLIF